MCLGQVKNCPKIQGKYFRIPVKNEVLIDSLVAVTSIRPSPNIQIYIKFKVIYANILLLNNFSIDIFFIAGIKWG